MQQYQMMEQQGELTLMNLIFNIREKNSFDISNFFLFRQGRSLDRQITTQDIDCLRVCANIKYQIPNMIRYRLPCPLHIFKYVFRRLLLYSHGLLTKRETRSQQMSWGRFVSLVFLKNRKDTFYIYFSLRYVLLNFLLSIS